jgi:hypothetical protein
MEGIELAVKQGDDPGTHELEFVARKHEVKVAKGIPVGTSSGEVDVP